MRTILLILLLALPLPLMADSTQVMLTEALWIDTDAPTSNYGTSTTMSFGYSYGERYLWLNGAIDAAVAGIEGTIDSGKIYLYCSSVENFTSTDSLIALAYECLRAGVETEMTWNIYSTGNSWTTPGAGGAGTDVSSDSVSIARTILKASEISVDDTVRVTTIIGSVIAAGVPYGIILKADTWFNDESRPTWETDDDVVASHRPYIMLYHSEEEIWLFWDAE